MAKGSRKILSVGGSIIIPHAGFDVGFLKKFKKLILKHVAAGEKFILTIVKGFVIGLIIGIFIQIIL